MISHTHKFIIILPHKTASTSLVTSLIDVIDVSKIIEQKLTFDFNESNLTGRRKHARLNSYRDKWVNTYKLFGVIRNPYERLVSWWFYSNRVNKKNKSFIDFLKSHPTLQRNIECYQYFGGKIDSSTGGLIRYENLQNDFNNFCECVGLPNRKLPRKNATKHKHYTEYYDDETRSIVAKKFKGDITRFGYEFGM